MRISDWSSDVCSSDLYRTVRVRAGTEDANGAAHMTILSIRIVGRRTRAPGLAARSPAFPAVRRDTDGSISTTYRCPEKAGTGENHQCSPTPRSEEHTSELQSLMRISYAVFCLKNKHNNLHNPCTDLYIIILLTN